MKYTITLTYIFLATLWIIFSDALVDTLVTDNDFKRLVNSSKGIAFVLATALVVFIMLHLYSRRQQTTLQRLRDQEKGFRQLFTNNPHPMWIYDRETLRFLDVNLVALEKYGYTREEFAAMTIADIRPKEDVERLLSTLQQPRRPWQSSGEWRHRLKSGQVIDVDVASHTLVFEGQAAAMIMVTDISAKKQAERDLLDVESRLENVLSGVEDVVRIMDAKTNNVYYISPAVEKVYGRQAQEFYDDPELLLNTVHPDDQTMIQQKRIERLASGEWDIEVRIVHPDGQIRWIHDRSRIIFDAGGNPVRLEGITTDISEKRRIQEEQKKNQALEQALQHEAELSKLRHRFTSLMSHEFRNPLAAVFSTLEILERYHDQLSPEKRIAHIVKGKSHIKRMVGLLDDILMLMYTENIGPAMKLLPMDFADLLRDIANDMQPRLSAHHTLSLLIPEMPVRFAGDEKLLRQAVENLLANAIKYSPDGGEIRVILSCSAAEMQLQICDEGIGIPAHDLPGLFEAFQRASNVGGIQGTGLGLAMVKEVVQLHQGRIEVNSEPGKGTGISLYLPVVAVEA